MFYTWDNWFYIKKNTFKLCKVLKIAFQDIIIKNTPNALLFDISCHLLTRKAGPICLTNGLHGRKDPSP